MYRILIIDDEADIRKGLGRFLEKNATDYTVVATCEDGEEALALSWEMLPDVIITDINMPNMDGLEYLEAIKEVLPSVQTLVISGYDKFEYAVSCLHLGVREYLLKPVNTDQLLEILAQIKKELDEQNALWKRVPKEKKTSGALTRAVRNVYLGEETKEALEEGEYLAAVMSGEADLSEVFERLQMKLLGMGEVAEVAKLEQGRLLVFSVPKPYQNQGFLHITRILTMVHNYFRREEQKRVFFFLGGIVKNSSELARSMEEAKTCARSMFLGESVAVTSYQERMAQLEQEYEHWPKESLRRMVLAAECGNEQESQAAFLEWSSRLSDGKIADAQMVRALFLTAGFQAVLDLSDQGHGVTGSVWQEYQNQLETAKSMEETYQSLIKLCQQLRQKRENQRKPRLKEQVDAMIMQHLDDSEFSLNDVAARLFLSPNYLRALWKQEMGVRFTEYLTNLRMERAKILLKGQSMKISDVAELVGYRDSRYFSSSFRRLYHMSPGEYQSQEKEREL